MWTQETSYRGKSRALETGSRGLAWDKLPLPTVPRLKVLWEPLELRRRKQRYMPEEGRGGRGHGHTQERSGSYVLRVFICFLKAGIRGGLNQNIG